MNIASKASGTKASTEFQIHSRYTSLIDMINTRKDEYPSNTHLEASDHGNTFHNPKEFEKMEKLYNIQKPFKLILAGPGDRSCNLRENALCIYRDTLRARIRLPFNPFIHLLLADVRINPC